MTEGDRITRGDIEAKVRQLQGEVDTAGEAAKGPAMVIAGVVAVALLGVVFLLGKRRGKRQTTTIEIRRV
jgi:hypothetical protein